MDRRIQAQQTWVYLCVQNWSLPVTHQEEEVQKCATFGSSTLELEFICKSTTALVYT